MHILLVEDDPKLGPLIRYKLSQEYHTVEWVADPELAMEYVQQTYYDLYILDWMMQKKAGWSCVRRYGQATIRLLS
ncbi:hypothetical protein YSY22_36940 [Brevibacillus formosus]